MRITIDTREDSYLDALGVLRRAYGRQDPARKKMESTGQRETVDSSNGSVAKGSDTQPATSGGRVDAGLKKVAAKGPRKSPAKKTSAPRAPAAEPPASSRIKKVPAKKAARSASVAPGRPAGARKKAAPDVSANTAARGRPEAVRAWAQAQGMHVNAVGRMPARVIAAYKEAHKH